MQHLHSLKGFTILLKQPYAEYVLTHIRVNAHRRRIALTAFIPKAQIASLEQHCRLFAAESIFFI